MCVYVCLGAAAVVVVALAPWCVPSEGFDVIDAGIGPPSPEMRTWLSVGVMGETGGRTGEAEREVACGEWPLEVCGCDGGDLSTVRPGMVRFFFLLVGIVRISRLW